APAQKHDEICWLNDYAWLHCDADENLFFTVRTRHADGSRLENSGKCRHLGFDFDRGHILAAAPDRVLQPSDEEEVAVGIAFESVTRVKPAVAPGPSRCFRHVEIAGRNRPR